MDEVLEGAPTEADFPYDPSTVNSGICTADSRILVADTYFEYFDLE